MTLDRQVNQLTLKPERLLCATHR